MTDELSSKALVIQTLRAVCEDDGAPAAARAQAARTLGEIEGMLKGGGSEDRKSIADMSLGELDAEISRLSRTLAPK